MDLLASEIRVLGCLVEKQRTTPDAYPLTLNSLRLACNQSTNRDPVVSYQEDDLRDALHRLERRGFVRFAGGAGSRAPKYRHRLPERLPMDDAEQALMCVLMLRGAQTPGELKQRADRMHPFASLADVHETLRRLIERDLVMRLERRPGQKEERYGHLLEATEEQGSAVSASGAAPGRIAQQGSPAEQGPAPMSGSDLDTPGEGFEAAGEGAERQGIAPQAATSVPPAPWQASEHSAPQPAAAAAPAVGATELRDLRERVERLERELASLKAELGVGATE